MQSFERQARDHASLAEREDDEYEEGYTPTVAEDGFLASRNADFQNALAKLSRYETFLLSAFNRTLQQLLYLRSARPQSIDQLPLPKIEVQP